MNKAIAILILLSFLALGGVSIFYYFYYEGLEEVVVTYAKESQPINFKTWVVQFKDVDQTFKCFSE